jgi:coiled-coil domain-containing protein 6
MSAPDEDIAALKARVEALTAEVASERQKRASVESRLVAAKTLAETLAAKVDEEEEFLSNMLMAKVAKVENEKKELALRVEREEEFLTNNLQRRLNALQSEKVALERACETEQELMVNKLQTALESLGREQKTISKERDRLRGDLMRTSIETERLKSEKVSIEAALESEEEHVTNVLQGQISLLLKRNRYLERQIRALGGNVSAFSDSEGWGDDDHAAMSPTRAGARGGTYFGRAARARPSADTSPFTSDRESISPGRRRFSGTGGSLRTLGPQGGGLRVSATTTSAASAVKPPAPPA